MKKSFIVILVWACFLESSGFLLPCSLWDRDRAVLSAETSCRPCSVSRQRFTGRRESWVERCGERWRLQAIKSRLRAATELQSTEDRENKEFPPFSVRVLDPEDLTTLVTKDRVLPNLLEPVSHFCSQILYGSDLLHYSVLVDFQRRYGVNRKNRGAFLIATTQVTPRADNQACQISQQERGEEEKEKKRFDACKGILIKDSELLIGCAGLEILPLFANGAYAPVTGVRAGPEYAKQLEELLYRPLLSNLAVAQEHRGRGVGKELIKGCERAVMEMGFSELLLKVDHTNEGAYRLYRKLGYDEMEDNRLQEDKFVATEQGGKWEKTINISLRKSLGVM